MASNAFCYSLHSGGFSLISIHKELNVRTAVFLLDSQSENIYKNAGEYAHSCTFKGLLYSSEQPACRQVLHHTTVGG